MVPWTKDHLLLWSKYQHSIIGFPRREPLIWWWSISTSYKHMYKRRFCKVQFWKLWLRSPRKRRYSRNNWCWCCPTRQHSGWEGNDPACLHECESLLEDLAYFRRQLHVNRMNVHFKEDPKLEKHGPSHVSINDVIHRSLTSAKVPGTIWLVMFRWKAYGISIVPWKVANYWWGMPHAHTLLNLP